MSQRVWALVAVFAVLLVAIGVWSMTGGAPSPKEIASAKAAEKRAARQDIVEGPNGRPMIVGDPMALRDVRVPMDQLATRQALLAERMAHRGGTPSKGFPLDDAGVKAAFAIRHDEIQNCYTAAKAHDPALAANLTLQLEVVPGDGDAPASVSWVNSGASKMLDSCIENAFSQVRFAATEATTLRYPITFK